MVNEPKAMNALDRFLKTVQNRAFITARLATSNADEALDLVQDAMLKLVKKYADKPAEQWPALFQSILQNLIKDWYRRQKVRRILHWWEQHDETEEELPVDHGLQPSDTPAKNHETFQMNDSIYKALQNLPMRQQQAFLLRAWWEHSTEQTAAIMGCSQGSVKSHYSRATKALESQLQEFAL
jgi:RNA polymerase sigma-70 factor, ECF subfamily